MNARSLALILLAIPLFAMADETTQPNQRIDISSVTAIRITGEASSIALTTAPDEPLVATLGGRRTGWFAKWYSTWSYTDCRTSSRMHIDNATLYVDARPSSWLEPSNCQVELKANVRQEVSVAIEQAASQVRLAGDFSAISLDNKAADFTLDGHAASIRLSGDALRSHLSFNRTQGIETITIAAQALDTYLGFAPGTQISYDVEATAATVDSSLPNTAGAKPLVTIKGKFVRAAIR